MDERSHLIFRRMAFVSGVSVALVSVATWAFVYQKQVSASRSAPGGSAAPWIMPTLPDDRVRVDLTNAPLAAIPDSRYSFNLSGWADSALLASAATDRAYCLGGVRPSLVFFVGDSSYVIGKINESTWDWKALRVLLGSKRIDRILEPVTDERAPTWWYGVRGETHLRYDIGYLPMEQLLVVVSPPALDEGRAAEVVRRIIAQTSTGFSDSARHR